MADLSVVSTFQVDEGIFTMIEKELWPAIKEKLRPYVWAWYDANKDRTVARFIGIPIKFGQFGIVALAITMLVGARVQ